jgi:FkbM family methyltransferase
VTVANVFQAFPALIARLGFTPGHLVHVGAHEGQEMPYYREAGIKRITLVEPIPELAAQLRADHPDSTVVEAACGPAAAHANLHIMQKTNLSTLAAPRRGDRVDHVIAVNVRRLDDIAPDADAAVIDAQGMELDVLAAAPWPSLRLVIVETSTIHDPTMASSYSTVAALMAGQGFIEADRWVRDYDMVNRWGRGDYGQRATGGEIRDVAFIKEECSES